MAVLTIHATNVTGLGACQVVVSFLEAIDMLDTVYERIDCYVPADGSVAEFSPTSDKLKILSVKRRMPKALSRVAECLFPELFFRIGEHLIVLGDVPLRTRRKQLVLVHQPNMLSPRVNRWVGRTATFRTMRALTRFNAPYADHVVVQTSAMAQGLSESYRNWKRRDCVRAIGQPPPSWFSPPKREHESLHQNRGLRMFYPAAGYLHKNHRILESLLAVDVSSVIERLVLTVPGDRYSAAPGWLSCVGRLSHSQCLSEYQKADALLFPSVLESYGLPLVEAMVMGLPIVAADEPYARVLCGDEGVYFDPESADSMLAACNELKQRILAGWQPNWTSSLENMPTSWSIVVRSFLRQLEQDAGTSVSSST